MPTTCRQHSSGGFPSCYLPLRLLSASPSGCGRRRRQCQHEISDVNYYCSGNLDANQAATLALPFVGLRAFETFEQAALRCVPTNTTVAVPAARVAFLSTIETVPTARLHNRGRHTITFFMGVWVGATVVPADRSGAACSMWEWRTWRDLDGKVQVTPIDDPLQQLKWHYASENTTPVQQMIERIGECETKKEKAARLAAEKAAAKEAIKDVKARQAAAKASKKLQQQEVKAQEVQAKRQRKEAKRDSILRAQNADISSDTRGESSLEDDNTDVLERIARTQTLRAEEEASKKKCIVM